MTTTPRAWRGTSALAQGDIRTALGFHPQLAHNRTNELNLFDALLPHVRYVGEIGLDYSSEFRWCWNDQMNVFNHILNSCKKSGGRIMSIHSRGAVTAVLDCLEAHPNAGTPVLHWFSGSIRELERASALGCWFSVNPAMFSSSKGEQLVALMPRNRVLPESDGPFVQHNRVPLFPWNTNLVNEILTKLWKIEPNQIHKILMQNLSELVGNNF